MKMLMDIRKYGLTLTPCTYSGMTFLQQASPRMSKSAVCDVQDTTSYITTSITVLRAIHGAKWCPDLWKESHECIRKPDTSVYVAR